MNGELLSIDYGEVDDTVSRLLWGNDMPGFSEMISGFMAGEYSVDHIGEILLETGKQYFFSSVGGMRHIFLLSLVMAFFFLFSKTEKSGAAAETGFFVIFLLTAGELVAVVQDSGVIVRNAIDSLTDFLRTFLPVYCTGLAFSAGGSSAAAFYGVAFLGITAAGVVFQRLVLPLAEGYFLIALFNKLFSEDVLSKLSNLFFSAAKLLMKACVGGLLGIGSIRGLLAPAADGVKRSGFLKACGALPVVGDLFDGATQTVLAAGSLLKNAIGTAGAVVIFFLCFFPALKIGIGCVVLQIGSAVLQPVSDKRVSECLEITAKAMKLLFQVMMDVMLLFLLLILLFAGFTGIGGRL